jgi:hypothetical protein
MTMCGWTTSDQYHQSYPCNHKAKGTTNDGRPACGVHLAAERRRGENATKYVAARAREDAWADAVKAWGERHSLRLAPMLCHGTRDQVTPYSRARVTVSVDTLRQLLGDGPDA